MTRASIPKPLDQNQAPRHSLDYPRQRRLEPMELRGNILSTALQTDRPKIAQSCPVCKCDRFREREYRFRSPAADSSSLMGTPTKSSLAPARNVETSSLAQPNPTPKAESETSLADKATARVLQRRFVTDRVCRAATRPLRAATQTDACVRGWASPGDRPPRSRCSRA